MKTLGKLIFAFILIYYGHGVFENLTADDSCHGYDCGDVVQCPDGYAMYIPEEDKYLPCELYEQYVNLGNRSVLK